MQNDESDINGVAIGDHRLDVSYLEEQGNLNNFPLEKGGGQSSLGEPAEKCALTVISNGESGNQVLMTLEHEGNVLKTMGTNKEDETTDAMATTTKGFLTRSESSHDECRVCQHQTEEALIDLGCRCRGGLAKAHRSCIETWFHTRGSNTCEICQQVASNVQPPESHPSTNYWAWRMNPTFRGSSIALERQRGCFNPLLVAFTILIGGLLLDVLISISLGLSALPVNIIIGILILLGLGTILRLALECCHEWGLQRAVQRVDTHVNLGYHSSV